MISAALATVLFSLSMTFGHRSSKLIGGTEANFWRLTIGTLALGIWAYGFGIGLDGRAMPYFFVSGLIGFGVADVALYQALPRLGSRLTMVIVQCLGVPFGVLIEWIWLGTRLSLLETALIVAIVVGVAIALSPEHAKTHDTRVLRHGVIYSALAAFGGAFGAVLSRKAFAIAAAAGEFIDGANAAFQRIIAGLMVAGVWLLIVRWHKRLAAGTEGVASTWADALQKWRSVWKWVLANALAGSVLGVSCFLWALRTTPTGIVLAIVALAPLSIIPIARIFEREKITFRSAGGTVMAVGAVVGLVLIR